jgi:hypothetical protein
MGTNAHLAVRVGFWPRRINVSPDFIKSAIALIVGTGVDAIGCDRAHKLFSQVAVEKAGLTNHNQLYKDLLDERWFWKNGKL